MKYERPEVKILANAVDAVQTMAKNTTPMVDSTPRTHGPAYEADE